MRTFGSVILLSGLLSAFTVVQPQPASAQYTCGWYAIGGCFRQQWQAEDRAADLGDAYAVRTNRISNFAPGWWCAVDGPFPSRGDANSARRSFARMGVHDAYVKRGGC